MYLIPAYQPKEGVIITTMVSGPGSDSHLPRIVAECSDSHGNCKYWYRFNAISGSLIKVELKDVGKTFVKTEAKARSYLGLDHSSDPATFFSWVPDELKNTLREGILTLYSDQDEYKILVVDDVRDPETLRWLKENISKLREKKIICVIKCPKEPDENARIESFFALNSLSQSGVNFRVFDPEKFGMAGYFRDGEYLRCCGCTYGIDSKRFHELLSERRVSTLEASGSKSNGHGIGSVRNEPPTINVNSSYLELVDRDHKEESTNRYRESKYCHEYQRLYGAKPCLREYPVGNTFISRQEGDNFIDCQRYLELELHEEMGRSEIRTVPGCSLIPTHPETQVKILNLSYPYYFMSALPEEIGIRFSYFRKCIDAMKMESESKVQSKAHFASELFQKEQILINLEPVIEKIYDRLNEWKISHLLKPRESIKHFLFKSPAETSPCQQPSASLTKPQGTAEFLKLIQIKSVSNLHPEEKEGFKLLLGELLKVINSFNLDNQEVLTPDRPTNADSVKTCKHSMISKKGLAFLLCKPVPPSQPENDHSLSEATSGGFKDSQTIDRSTVEKIEPILEMLTKTVLQPIRFLLGDDYYALSTEIRQKIFLEPETVTFFLPEK